MAGKSDMATFGSIFAGVVCVLGFIGLLGAVAFAIKSETDAIDKMVEERPRSVLQTTQYHGPIQFYKNTEDGCEYIVDKKVGKLEPLLSPEGVHIGCNPSK